MNPLNVQVIFLDHNDKKQSLFWDLKMIDFRKDFIWLCNKPADKIEIMGDVEHMIRISSHLVKLEISCPGCEEMKRTGVTFEEAHSYPAGVPNPFLRFHEE